MKRRYKINHVWTKWLEEQPEDLDWPKVQAIETQQVLAASQAKEVFGYDIAAPVGDKSVAVHGVKNEDGSITITKTDEFISPPVLSTGPLPTLQQDAHGRLLCKCPACGDEWRVSTWPKLENDAKAQGWEEAMERVEENERSAVDRALTYAVGLIEKMESPFPKNYLHPVSSSDPGSEFGFEKAKTGAYVALLNMRHRLRLHRDIYNERP